VRRYGYRPSQAITVGSRVRWNDKACDEYNDVLIEAKHGLLGTVLGPATEPAWMVRDKDVWEIRWDDGRTSNVNQCWLQHA
jgi:hypothetical protein